MSALLELVALGTCGLCAERSAASARRRPCRSHAQHAVRPAASAAGPARPCRAAAPPARAAPSRAGLGAARRRAVDVGPATTPCTVPAAVDERMLPSARSAARAASACGSAVGVAPVSTRNSTATAVDPARPVVVTIRGAPDLDLAAVAVNSVRCWRTARPAGRGRRARPSKQPDRDDLERVREVLHGARRHGHALLDRAEHARAVVPFISMRIVSPNFMNAVFGAPTRSSRWRASRRCTSSPAPVLVAHGAAADDAAGAQPARLGDMRDQLAEVKAHLVGPRCTARRACRSIRSPAFR